MTIALRDCVSVQRHLEIGTEEDVNIKDVRLPIWFGQKLSLLSAKITDLLVSLVSQVGLPKDCALHSVQHWFEIGTEDVLVPFDWVKNWAYQVQREATS